MSMVKIQKGVWLRSEAVIQIGEATVELKPVTVILLATGMTLTIGGDDRETRDKTIETILQSIAEEEPK